MSTAHRPNFTAAKARAPGPRQSAQTSIANIPQHTKLKFRQPTTTTASSSSTLPSSSTVAIPGSSEDARRRDLKRELEQAEWEAKNRKRIKAGLEALPPPGTNVDGEEDEEAKRRREAIAQAIELDHSDSDSESDSEDEQTLLLRELEKIKAERAAEKHRLSTLPSSSSATLLTEQEQIARGNPLLNLQAAFSSSSSTPPTSNSTNGGAKEVKEFGVKKRWDHDVIFKNQAAAAGNVNGNAGGKGGFVNDLTRSEFHRKFINRYIK
ncbi:hypothetical protein [Sporisorium scitamineum]|uniref:Cell cycle control protein cwf15 n=1 Tax=Sporisorium scitamineum TaxID=49012 RepID=A0A0F7S1M0_9BASI|nr:hypothetical protein [Sporisorium scitamineum]